MAERGRSVQPDDWRIWLQSAEVSMELNELEAAREFLDQAWELDPRPEIIAARREFNRHLATTQAAE